MKQRTKGVYVTNATGQSGSMIVIFNGESGDIIQPKITRVKYKI